ncbi:hypothetical protein TgHK011_007876 [Trichoderma gracile]|nr:hypothetical protein TgHK011_007876 [Trichoderma gracile]
MRHYSHLEQVFHRHEEMESIAAVWLLRNPRRKGSRVPLALHHPTPSFRGFFTQPVHVAHTPRVSDDDDDDPGVRFNRLNARPGLGASQHLPSPAPHHHHQRRTATPEATVVTVGADSQSCTVEAVRTKACGSALPSERIQPGKDITQPAASGQSIDSARHTASRKKGGPISEALAVGLRTTPSAFGTNEMLHMGACQHRGNNEHDRPAPCVVCMDVCQAGRQASRLLVIASLWALPTILHTPITSYREKKRRACLCFLQEIDRHTAKPRIRNCLAFEFKASTGSAFGTCPSGEEAARR